MSGTLQFERAAHLRIVEPAPASEPRIKRTEAVAITREGSQFWVEMQTVTGGQAWVKVSRSTLSAFIDAAKLALETAR